MVRMTVERLGQLRRAVVENGAKLWDPFNGETDETALPLLIAEIDALTVERDRARQLVAAMIESEEQS